MESVIIQEERHHHILNSKSEYNRCSLPRLTAKLGEKEWKRMEKDKETELEKEKRLERRILEMRKTRNNMRRGEANASEQPAEKRRKTGEKEWKSVRQKGEVKEKRKGEETESDDNKNKRR